MSDTFHLHGLDLFGEPVKRKQSGPLAARFEFSPFSVLNARSGEWQERKRAWLALGIRSEVGRGADSAYGGNGFAGWRGGVGANDTSRMAAYQGAAAACSTSTFDPVLCELAYRWWCRAGGLVLDPFAGGSVRGIIAGLLGYRYHGIDLRAEQTAANEEQRKEIAPDAPISWACGDSMDLLSDAPEADFVFSCPPYGDLERYSDLPEDLSTMEYHTFLAAYRRIILRCSQKLKPNRFACFVVGDFRDRKTGSYRGFVADTVNAFREIGMPLYNDAVLVTAVGSLPIRVSAQFDASRKLGKTHQNVLVFVNGDARKAFDATPLADGGRWP